MKRRRRRGPAEPVVLPAVVQPDLTKKREESPRLGLLLVDSGALSAETLGRVLEDQPESGLPLGELLVDLGVIDDRMLTHALSRQLRMPLADLRTERPEREAIELIEAPRARGLQVLPLRLADGRLDVAIAEPRDERLMPFLTGLPVDVVRLHLAPASDVRAAVNLAYPAIAGVDDRIASFTTAEESRVAQSDAAHREASEEEAAVMEVVTQILTQAVRDRASDIHIEPMNDRDRVRLRIDGALEEMLSLPPKMGQGLVGHVKSLGHMSGDDRRQPHDGQFHTTIDGHEIDVRVAVTTTIWGDKAVLRLLDKSRPLKGLAELGMSDEHHRDYSRAVRAPFGMVIVSGPTGSGKTTTLYATLSEINRDDINVMTIEDPVEYVFPSINQIQLNEQADVTFASGLQSILRQDPNVILIGEVRDAETARIAVQSALTGHMVLTSIHATDSVAALYRLLDLGIEPFPVGSSIVGVVAQRLVRRICEACAARYEPTEQELTAWAALDGGPRDEWIKGLGCNICRQTGYLDRIGVFEVLMINDEIRQAVAARASLDDVRRLALSQGLRTLQQEAVRLATSNVTTTEEIIRNVYGGQNADIIPDWGTDDVRSSEGGRGPEAGLADEPVAEEAEPTRRTSAFQADHLDTAELDERILALAGRSEPSVHDEPEIDLTDTSPDKASSDEPEPEDSHTPGSTVGNLRWQPQGAEDAPQQPE